MSYYQEAIFKIFNSKKMITITKISGFLIVLAIVFSSVYVRAQHTERTPEQRAEYRSERLSEKLSLNEKQKQQVYDIFLYHAGQADVIKDNENITKESRREQMKTLRTETDQKLQGVFTKEQIDKWNSMKQKMKEKHGKKKSHKNHGKKNKK